MIAIDDCPHCGASLQVPEEEVGGKVECPECGKKFLARALDPRDDEPRGRGRPSTSQLKEASSKKIAAGICGILLGGLGIHKFILGFTTAGVIMLLVTLLTCGIGAMVMGVIGLVEGILYLVKSDEEFYRVYMVEKKEWF